MEAWFIGLLVVHLLLVAFALGIVASTGDAPWTQYLGALLGLLFLLWLLGYLLGSRLASVGNGDKGEVDTG